MNLSEIRALRSGIISAAYQEDTEILRKLGMKSQFLSDVTQLREVGHQNNIAAGYSFRSSNPDDARLELRVPSTSKKAIRAADSIARELGNENVNIKYTKAASMLTAAERPDPTRGGILYPGASIGSENGTGSLGGFAVDDDGSLQILSCSHVLAYHPSAGRTDNLKGQLIYHPGPVDLAPTSRNHVATLYGHTIFSEQWCLKSDSAYATLEEDVKALGNRLHDSHIGTLGFADARIYEPVSEEEYSALKYVYKVGKTTGLTRGLISAVGIEEYSITVSSPKKNRHFTQLRFSNVMEIEWEEGQPFSQPGDSGGLLFCKIGDKLHAMGLVFASGRTKMDEKSKEYSPVTLACSMTNVLAEHSLSWFNDVE